MHEKRLPGWEPFYSYDTPIWKKSTIASEPDIDINNLPCFYIDSTTREGMSGAPVVFFSKDGIYKSSEYLFAVADRAIYQFVGVLRLLI